MLADLDLLLTAVFCTADDLLPEERENARRSLTDAEVATLRVAQASAGREFAAEVEARFAAQLLRPARKDEPRASFSLSVIRQRIESVFLTLKDRLCLERHRARTLNRLRARIASKLLALAAGVWVNSWLGSPGRSFI